MGLTDITTPRKRDIVRGDFEADAVMPSQWKRFFDGTGLLTFGTTTQVIIILTPGKLKYSLKFDNTVDEIDVIAGMQLPGDVDKIEAATSDPATGLVQGI